MGARGPAGEYQQKPEGTAGVGQGLSGGLENPPELANLG